MLPSLVSDFWYAISDRRKKMADKISVRPTMFATYMYEEDINTE